VLSTSSQSDKPTLGICEHVYWPFRIGTSWTFNNPQTSFTQRLDKSQDNQVYLSTEYEGQPIEFNLECYQDGLGGDFVGEMRRLIELGALNFKNVEGLFLPRPEIMEQLGTSWTQEFKVTGTVPASQGGQPVVGQIRDGQAAAIYTPTGFETLETPLGLRDGLRIEQQLDLDLTVDFQLNGQTIPATELIHLTNVYWFVKGIGLVKMQWQGGMAQYQFDNTALNQQVSIPALIEDQLVFVCILSEQKSSDCIRVAGIFESDLTTPSESELVIPLPIFPSSPDLASSTGSAAQLNPNKPIPLATLELPGTPTNMNDYQGNSALLAYAEAVAKLGEKISSAGGAFGEAAIDYRNNELSLVEFQNKFTSFASNVREYISAIDNLSAPPEAQEIHQKLADGLDKCDQAIDLMDEWFDTQDSDTKDATMLLVANCMDQVTQAGDELKSLITN
jgi:hypothetical protein